jgi:hypothetical protein
MGFDVTSTACVDAATFFLLSTVLAKQSYCNWFTAYKAAEDFVFSLEC